MWSNCRNFCDTLSRGVIRLDNSSGSLGVEDGAEYGGDNGLERGDLQGGQVSEVLLKRRRFLQQGGHQKYIKLFDLNENCVNVLIDSAWH